MTRLPPEFIEDRALRDAARAVLLDDLAHIKASLEEQGVASRVTSSVTGSIGNRVSAGARDLLELAKAQASDNAGVLAALVGAIILWFARAPLLAWLGLGEEPAADESTEAQSPPDPDAPSPPPPPSPS